MHRGALLALDPAAVEALSLALGVGSLAFLRPALDRLDRPGSRGYALFVGAVGLYGVATAVNLVSTDLAVSLAANKAVLSSGVVVGLGWLLLGVDVRNGVDLTAPVAVAGAVTAASVVLIWVNPLGVVIGADAHVEGTVLVHTAGDMYAGAMATTFLFVVAGTALLAVESHRSSGVRRRQTGLLAVAILPTLAGGVLTAMLLTGVDGHPYDYTLFGYALTGVVVGVALFRTGFLDVTPVARGIAVGEMRDAMVTLDHQDRVVDCNRRARELLGVDDGWAGTQASAFFEAVTDADRPGFWTAIDGETDVTATVDGVRRHFSVSVTPVGDRATRGRVVLLHDVTERRRRERDLREFEAAVEQAGFGIMMTDETGTITFVNPAMVEQTGYPPNRLVGSTPALLNSGEHDDAFFEDFWSTIRDGETWHGEVVNERADGTRYTVSQTVAPIRDDDGDLQAFVSVNNDVSERKVYERRVEEQRDGLCVLNSVVRHDIRNDLQSVLGHAEILDDHVDSDGRRHLAQVLSNAREAVDITETARDVTEVVLRSSADLEAVRLDRVVHEAVGDCRSTHDSATVTVDGTVPGVVVCADEMLEAVFRNLFQNAVMHATDGAPTVRVRVDEGEETVRVSVADDGPGIPEERRSTVFEEGESGPESTGTGMGLYLVDTLVDTYGGDVWVTDGDLGGATFVVELPTAN